MGGEIPQLQIFFFPFPVQGHVIPTVDMAKLFATRGVKTSIITTPDNAPLISKSIEKSKQLGIDIDIKIIEFPSAEAGLPERCENADVNTTAAGEQARNMESIFKFLKATNTLREPLELLLGECKPDCLVADMFFPWTTDAAAKFGIPRLVFHGVSFFSLCIAACIWQYQPLTKVSSDSEPFVVPNLPGDIKLTRNQLPDDLKQNLENDFNRTLKESRVSELKSFGVIVNSFYELEPVYADYYRNVLGRRAWHIGPLSLCSRNVDEDKALKGKQASIDEDECLKWLHSKKPNSVIYICFGSLANFTSAQIMEIAIGLEASGQNFILVVRKDKKGEEGKEDWLPEGFEKRMEGRGLIVRGWAPQVLILNDEAVGGFVTHCGWNSALEGISAGLPMVTWPIFGDQFFNEKLITDVLKIGVSVRVQEWIRVAGDYVKSEAIVKAVKEIMVGDRAEELRSRAKALGELARKAVEEGGLSYNDVGALIEELKAYRG